MKQLFIFFLLFSSFCFCQDQTVIKNLLLKDNAIYIGKIADSERIEVKLLTMAMSSDETFDVTGEADVNGNKSLFKGTITQDSNNSKGIKNLKKSGMYFYKFEFIEEKGDDHTGILSGSLAMKILNDIISISVFEGYWENHIKTIKHPVYFDNSDAILQLKPKN